LEGRSYCSIRNPKLLLSLLTYLSCTLIVPTAVSLLHMNFSAPHSHHTCPLSCAVPV
jgi:hypothetical protein